MPEDGQGRPHPVRRLLLALALGGTLATMACTPSSPTAGSVLRVSPASADVYLDGDLGILRDLYRLGLRSTQLPAHNWANNFADSCCAPAKWHGLNEHGRSEPIPRTPSLSPTAKARCSRTVMVGNRARSCST